MNNREEAIKYGTEWLKDEYLDARDGAFIEIALEALKREPCDDAINREDALMCLTGEIKETDTIETIIARIVRRIRKLPPVNPTKTGHCKDCKWWKDSNGTYCRGVHAESKCPINRKEVYEGNGYCYMFEPQERSDKEC